MGTGGVFLTTAGALETLGAGTGFFTALTTALVGADFLAAALEALGAGFFMELPMESSDTTIPPSGGV